MKIVSLFWNIYMSFGRIKRIVLLLGLQVNLVFTFLQEIFINIE